MLLLSIDPADSRPVYRQIADEVRRSIAIGVLKANDALPAVRQLGRELKVNANTVQHAYRTLETESVVFVKRGLGTFVATVSKDVSGRRGPIARQIAERALRETYRHGLLASDLMRALEQLAPRPLGAGSEKED
jgi:GntR family transcriptional regulator